MGYHGGSRQGMMYMVSGHRCEVRSMCTTPVELMKGLHEASQGGSSWPIKLIPGRLALVSILPIRTYPTCESKYDLLCPPLLPRSALG